MQRIVDEVLKEKINKKNSQVIILQTVVDTFRFFAHDSSNCPK